MRSLDSGFRLRQFLDIFYPDTIQKAAHTTGLGCKQTGDKNNLDEAHIWIYTDLILSGKGYLP